MQDFKEYVLWNGVTPKAIVSSTNASPSVLTVTSHGFSTGDLVQVFGHTTNTAVNGIWKVVVASASTFSLVDINTGAAVAGNGVGGATGVVLAAPKIAFSQDFDTAVLEVGTTGTATMTVQLAIAQGLTTPTIHGDTPNFGATISATNNYSFVQLVDMNTNISVDGTTGIVVAGSDIQKMFEVNVNRVKYMCPIIKSWSAGAIYAKLTLYKLD